MTPIHRSRGTQALRALLVPLLALLVASPALTQDARTLFRQGLEAFQNGDNETAISRFRDVIRLDPTQVEAYQLLTESEEALLDLMMDGGEFATFAQEILTLADKGRLEAIRDPSAAAADAEKCFGGSYAERSRAVFELGMKYGPFATVPLVKELAAPSEERRLEAIYALSRLGTDAIVPLLAATHSARVDVRRGALLALGQLGDDRARARIVDMAFNDPEGPLRVMAGEFAGPGSPGEFYVQQGWAYYSNDLHMGLTEVENYGVLWNIDGSQLTPVDVPPSLVALELAKQQFLRAGELNHREAGVGLASTYAAEIAALTGNEDLEDARRSLIQAAQTLSQGDVDRALDRAIREGQIATAEALVRLLDGPGLRQTRGLWSALRSQQPNLRHASAIALANAGQSAPEIVSALGSAIEVEAVRVVEIIDPDRRRAQELANGLADEGIAALVSSDGTDGLIMVLRGLPVDAFVIADPLPDMYARRVVKEIRREDRYSDTPILVLGNSNTGEIEGAEVTGTVDVLTVTDSFGDLDAERRGYLATATEAARAMAGLAQRDPNQVAVHGASLLAAAERDDQVALPALHAVERAGRTETLAGLLGIVGDTGRSGEVRAAAARAAAGVIGRNQIQEADQTALLSGLDSGDPDLGTACARALGLLGAGHVPAVMAGPQG